MRLSSITTSSTASSGYGTKKPTIPNELPEPEELITDAMEALQLALDDLTDMQKLLEAGNGGEL